MIANQALPESESSPSPSPVVKADADPLKIFFTGKMRSGKDFVAQQAGLTIFSFAEPLYDLLRIFFGLDETKKDLPGCREFMQTVGQWGRGEINEHYPCNVTRAVFTQVVADLVGKKLLDDKHGVNWFKFGNPDIWADALLKRVEKSESKRVGVVNVRFMNEFKTLKDAGWEHYHVMCSPATWVERLRAAGLNPNSPQVKDTSEKLALGLDQQVAKIISQKPSGNKLKVIWSDEKMSSPSPRIQSVKDFLQSISVL